jgi:threonine/homoserine/homoserine lactone efflux protein
VTALLPTFVGTSALVIMTPGQDTALTIRNTILGGRMGGIFTAVGVSAGQATWTVVTSVGVGAVLVAFAPALVALRLLGAAYLAVLGGQALWRALRSGDHQVPGQAGSRRRPLSPHTTVRQGLLSNLGNPKMLAVFTSLLPQFTRSVAGLLGLGLVFCAMTLMWLMAYAVVVSKAGSVFRGRRVHRAVEALTGIVLIGLGVRLATERGA